MFKKIVGFVLLLFLSAETFSQVTVQINSGNPSFPFPQFLDYGPDRKTLASVNAPGVTHAEMEQKTRDAWQIFANSFVYSGEVWGGVKYIKGNVGCPYDCSEGDGYALIAAAAMGDKPTFDGLWMRTHDLRMVKHPRYRDGVVPRPDYKYGDNTLAEPGGDAATDGDFDIALGILMAWKQWGDNMGINDFNGKPISYKEAAINVMKGIVEKKNSGLGDCRSVSGNVGFDGYVKNGNTWTELTDWASNRTPECPEYKGPQFQYVDYIAPAYLHAFGKVLEAENADAWDISQMKRAEASSDWIMGQAIKSPTGIPWAGNMRLDASGLNPTFTKFNEGEDFRMPWRTILNYVWHGNPSTSWDPITHQVTNTPNTYEKDNAVRLSQFLSNPQGAPWTNGCDTYGGGPDLTYKGPSTLTWYSSPSGVKSTDGFTLNWIHGTGSPAAIGAQDFDLMGKMFRQCVIEWEHADGTDYYLGSKPRYFHGWFRLLGMLVLAGNHHSPLNMVAKPNMKVYHKIDKTYGFTNDVVTYKIYYRNYGSVDAAGTVVKFGLPSGFQFVSANKSGALSGDSVVWNVGTVKGFVTGGLAATMDSMTVTLKIGPNSTGRYCTNARISSTDGSRWVSNEYPNNKSAVLERNCVDVIKRALKITKTADREEYNPGQEVKYKIKFENSSDAGWLNGGRPGVTIGFAHLKGMANPASANQNELKFRLYHDAVEPYIDYGNYRVSYFVNDPTIKCYFNPATCPNGWELQNTIKEGVNPDSVKAFQENIVEGSDAQGSWNQRIVLQFSHQLATTTQHLSNYYGLGIRVHEGGTEPLRGVWRWYPKNYNNVDWTDDWSWDPDVGDDDGGLYFPVGEDYTDIFNPGKPVTSWHTSACTTSAKIVKNVLVEEFDGYTWRRAFGNGPSPGRDLTNVVVRDTLPVGVTFKSFIRDKALGVSATTSTVGGRTVIIWSIPAMQVNQKDSILFIATVGGSCPGSEGSLVNNAWISAQTESPISDAAIINVTCSPVTICPTATTIIKTSDKAKYESGQQVKYSINYTQTQGSITNPLLNTSTDWKAQSGNISVPQFATNGITLPGMNNGENIVLTHDNSYGTNTLGNGIEGTFQLQSSENNFALVVRHSGGTVNNGVYINFKTDGGTNPTYVDIYSGTSKLNTSSFAVDPGSTFDFRIQLNQGTLNMWLVPNGQPISGAANIIQTGIPERIGYAGIAHGVIPGLPSYGSHRLINWKAHMDVAYNVQIVDSIPTNIINPISISNSGVLSSDSKAIVWTLPSPMAYNTTATLTWEGTYNVCSKTTNIAYVNTRGITGNQYGVCYEITCGTCAAPIAAVIRDTTIATGGTTTLIAKLTPTSTSFVYNWYKLIGVRADTVFIRSTKVNTLSVSDTGRYVVRVFDGDTTNRTCSRLSNTAKVSPSNGCTPPIALITTPTPVAYCANLRGTTLTAQLVAGMDYQWFKRGIPVGTNNRVLANADSGVYTVRVGQGTCTASSAAVLVTITPQPVAEIDTVASKLTYCIGSTGELVAKNAGARATYIWLLNGIAQGPASALNTYSPPNPTSLSSWQVQTILDGCSDTSSAVVMREVGNISTDIEIVADKMEACVGSTVLVSVTKKTIGNIQWYKDNLLQTETGNAFIFTFAQSTLVKAVLSTTESCANPKSDADSVAIQLNSTQASVDLLVDKTLPVCEGQALTFLARRLTGVTTEVFEWTVNGLVQPQQTDSIFTSAALKNTNKVKVSTGDACVPGKVISDSLVLNLIPSVVPSLNLLPIGTLACQGQNVTFKVDQKSGQGLNPDFAWFVNGAQQSIGKADTFRFPITAKSTVYASMTSQEACAAPKAVNSDTLTIDVTKSVTPALTINMRRLSPCPGDNRVEFFVVSQEGGGVNPVYRWYLNQALVETGPTYASDALFPGDGIVATMQSSFECRTLDSAVSNPLVYLAPEDLSISLFGNLNNIYSRGICRGDGILFEVQDNASGIDPLTYAWYVNTTQQIGAVGKTISIATLQTGDTVRVKAISNSCPNLNVQDWMTVTVDDKPLEGFRYGTGTVFFCAGNDTVVTALESNPNYAYTWLKGGQTVGTGTSATISEGGSYTLEIKNGGCVVRNEFRAQNATLVVKALADPVNFVPGDPVKLAADVDNPYNRILSFLWKPSLLIQPSTLQQVTFYPMETLWISVRVRTSEGCEALDSIEIIKTDRLFVPNAITPESGDQNAFWDIRGTEAFPELEVKVFNRWGSLVHEQKGYSKPWDGTLDGKPLPTGTYYYVLKDRKFGGPKVGDLTIVK